MPRKVPSCSIFFHYPDLELLLQSIDDISTKLDSKAGMSTSGRRRGDSSRGGRGDRGGKSFSKSKTLVLPLYSLLLCFQRVPELENLIDLYARSHKASIDPQRTR